MWDKVEGGGDHVIVADVYGDLCGGGGRVVGLRSERRWVGREEMEVGRWKSCGGERVRWAQCGVFNFFLYKTCISK